MIGLIKRIIRNLLKHSHKKTNKKWFERKLSHKELIQFVEAVRNGKSGNALTGNISSKTAKEIKKLIGTNVTKIILESSAIIHTEKDVKHHLKQDDIFKYAEVINNPRSVKKSPKKNRENPVLLFEGDINGSIIFVVGVHIKHGELSLITAYRKNEAGQGSTGLKNPGTYVQDGLPPTSTLSITQQKTLSIPS